MNLPSTIVAQHLWQSTVFAGLVALATLLLRNNHARSRHALWMMESIKFLLPFFLLTAAGAQLGSRIGSLSPAPASTLNRFLPVLEGVNALTTKSPVPAIEPVRETAASAGILMPLLFAVWMCGCLTIVL